MKQGRQIQLGLQGLSDFLDSLLLECGFAVSSVQRRKVTDGRCVLNVFFTLSFVKGG